MNWTWTAPASAADERADLVILKAMEAGKGLWSAEGERPVCSRNQLHRLIAEGQATADAKPFKANTKFRAGARIQITFPPPRSLELVAENRPLDILFQDEHLAVINKPAGLTVHPSSTQMDKTLVHALLHHIKDLSGIGGVLRPGIVHRIDKDTSGVMVISKSDAAHQALVKIFAKHEIERRYWALCYGVLAKPVHVESLIGRNPADRKKMSMKVKQGRKAVTDLRPLESFGDFASLVEARLETGRTHQVRVHLTGQGHSILGDPVYGVPTSKQPKWLELPKDVREAVLKLPGQALHARVLGFKHPITGKDCHFEAEPPEEFRLLLETLRQYGDR